MIIIIIIVINYYYHLTAALLCLYNDFTKKGKVTMKHQNILNTYTQEYTKI